jgi:hypothetical protein
MEREREGGIRCVVMVRLGGLGTDLGVGLFVRGEEGKRGRWFA